VQHIRNEIWHIQIREDHMNQQNLPIPSDAISALEHGNKIEAIRITRETAWMTLKQAKLATEAFLDANPSLKAKCEESNRTYSGAVFVMVVAAAVAVVALFLR
jgi:hypothetical protein